MVAADGGEGLQDLSRELNQVKEYPHGHFMAEHSGTRNSKSEAQGKSVLVLEGQPGGQSGWSSEGLRGQRPG